MKYGENVIKKPEASEKKKKVLDKYAKSIDYVDVFNQMREETFNYCIDRLFPMFDYCVLTRDDIRRVDVLEQLVGIQKRFDENNKEKNIGFLNYYLQLLEKYYNNLVNCEEGSRAAKCKDRGYEVLVNAAMKEGTIYDIEDSVVILLCLFREIKDKANISDYLIRDMSISVTKEDVDLVNLIIDYKFQAAKGVMKKPAILEKIKFADDNNEYDAKIMYMNSVIFLCLGLQERGILGKE